MFCGMVWYGKVVYGMLTYGMVCQGILCTQEVCVDADFLPSAPPPGHGVRGIQTRNTGHNMGNTGHTSCLSLRYSDLQSNLIIGRVQLGLYVSVPIILVYTCVCLYVSLSL